MIKNNNMLCQRSYSVEMRAETGEENNEHRVVGYAAVYDDVADIYGMYKEKIARGAFDGCKFKDVIFCINHETRKIPLARSRNNNSQSTMKLAVDDIGLNINALLDTENNMESRALYSAAQRGDMDSMSFIFLVADEEWEDLDSKMPTRTITKIAEVYEVTAATIPFYKGTTLDARASRSLESDTAALESAREKAKTALESAKASRANDIYKLRAKIGF